MNDTFVRACRGEPVDYTPIWIMRQAGRYLPEYKKIRSKVDFLTLCKTPDLAAEVTLQPVDILGVDAAILFSDILIPLEPMGIRLKFYEKKGPVLKNPVRDIKDIKKLRNINPDDELPFVIEAIKILREELRKKVPLIGFSGAPFTLATYIIEGGSSKNFINTKRMMYQHPQLFRDLMTRITNNTIAYLTSQIKAGAQAVQLFDSWAGVLRPYDYENYILPFVKDIINQIKNLGVPVIYFINNCAGLIHIAKKCGAHVIGIDWRIDMYKAVKQIGGKSVIQGNLDPCTLFSNEDYIKETAKDIVDKAYKAKGHIFNLGHGILPDTPVDSARALVDAVHEISRR